MAAATLRFGDDAEMQVECGDFWFSIGSNVQVMARIESERDAVYDLLLRYPLTSAKFDRRETASIEKILANNPHGEMPTLILEIRDQEISIQPFIFESGGNYAIFRQA